MFLLRAFIAGLMILTFACGPREAEIAVVEDIVVAAPEHARLLLENDHVAVMRFTLPPQAELPMHEGRARVVYSLSDYKLQYRTEIDPPIVRDLRQGEAHWHSAGPHSVRNVGPITAEYVVVARKSPNPTPGVTSNLAALVPDQARVIFENEYAKVIEVTMAPGAKQPMHNAASRVVYSLTPAMIRFITSAGSAANEYAEGDVHYHEGGEHQVENLSNETVRFVIFELM